MPHDHKDPVLVEDDVEPVSRLLRLRIPSLLIGLVLGILLSFVTSRFEEVLARNISVAFFIPFIIYMADAVGTQTQTIYTRDLRSGKADFKIYLLKETILGIVFGLIFSLITIPVVYFWFGSTDLVVAVALSTFGAITTAPLIALIVTEILHIKHTDPAVGAGPIATVIQDTVSVVIYGAIASLILL